MKRNTCNRQPQTTNYVISKTKSFMRDLRRLKQKPHIVNMVEDALQKLKKGERLPKEHYLIGDLKGHKECHLRYGLLLEWVVNGLNIKILRVGTHHQLLGR